MGKEGFNLLLNISCQILKWINTCHPAEAVCKQETIMYIANGDFWAKNQYQHERHHQNVGGGKQPLHYYLSYA
jgi:hypothetical protein